MIGWHLMSACLLFNRLVHAWSDNNQSDIILVLVSRYCLQCFDAVDWAAGRASTL